MYLRIKVDSWSPRIPSGVRWTGLQTNSLQPQHKTHRKTLFDWICPGPTCLGEMTQEDFYHEIRLPEHLRVSNTWLHKKYLLHQLLGPKYMLPRLFQTIYAVKKVPCTLDNPLLKFVNFTILHVWTMNNTVICGVRISPNAHDKWQTNCLKVKYLFWNMLKLQVLSMCKGEVWTIYVQMMVKWHNNFERKQLTCPISQPVA